MTQEYQVIREHGRDGSFVRLYLLDPTSLNKGGYEIAPNGFDFGNSGPGTRQLAIAILTDTAQLIRAADARAIALEHNRAFVAAYLAHRIEDSFAIKREDVARWLARTCAKSAGVQEPKEKK